MSERNSAPPLGFQVKRRPMAEAVAFAEMIARRYGRGRAANGSEQQHAEPHAPAETARDSAVPSRSSGG